MWWLIAGVAVVFVVTDAANRWLVSVSHWNRRVAALTRTDPVAGQQMHANPPMRVRVFNRIAR